MRTAEEIAYIAKWLKNYCDNANMNRPCSLKQHPGMKINWMTGQSKYLPSTEDFIKPTNIKWIPFRS